MSKLIGTAVGRYQLEALLGIGGMAEVYRAVDRELGRSVAVKVVLPHIAGQLEFRERFQREARLVAALEHPHIVPVYDVGEHEGLPFLVMPFYDGGSLASRLDGKPLPGPLVGQWLRDLAQALDAAHAAGVLHRDVKPSNVLIDGFGRALLADFGVALAANAHTRLTTTGAVVGTPGYMAPEIAMGERATPASDRYSLAVMAYEMVTGQVPFSGESAIAVLHQHATRPVPPLAERLPGASEELDRVLRRGLAKRPEERSTTALAFALELSQSLGQSNITGSAVSASAPTQPVARLAPPQVRSAPTPPTRIGRLAWLGMAALLVVGTLGGLMLWRGLEPAPSELQASDLGAPSEEPRPEIDADPQHSGETSSPTEKPSPSEPRPSPPPPSTVVAAGTARPNTTRVEPAEQAPSSSPPADEPATHTAAPSVAEPETEAETESALVPTDAPAGPTPPIFRGGGPRRFNALRQREAARRTQRLGAADFAEMANRANTLAGRPGEAGRARAMSVYARGGTAYVEGRFEEASRSLSELLNLQGLGALAGGPGPVPLLVLRERPTTGAFESWELALAYGDARGEGLAAIDAAAAESPKDGRLRMGRAQLLRLDGQHQAAASEAEAAYQSSEASTWKGAVALFLAEEHINLGNFPAALAWYRSAVAQGGRMAGAAALEAARFAEEQLRDRNAVVEFLTVACRGGHGQACRRLEHLGSP